MAKNVVLSFDDGRLDTYTNAYKILKKYGMTCTVNVVTDFVENEENYSCFKSANNKSMSKEQVLELEKNGVEIACHGHTHQNTPKDVLENIEHLNIMGIDTSVIGFASPRSQITEDNTFGVGDLVENKVLSYIRSGIQVRREGFAYAFFSYVERYTHSKCLFYLLNKRNVLKDESKRVILPSVAITKYTRVKQISYMLDKMKDGDTVILMFHSVLGKDENGYGVDNWCFDLEKFEQLCKRLANADICVCTTRDLVVNKNKQLSLK